jgi:hypothetical protein
LANNQRPRINDMSEEILSVAVFEAVEDKDKDALATLRELARELAQRGYSRDSLYCEKATKRYILVRHWTSAAARREAQEDPAALRCWARLADQINIIKIYETLDEVPL